MYVQQHITIVEMVDQSIKDVMWHVHLMFQDQSPFKAKPPYWGDILNKFY
jgi:hypothetical protein